MKEDRNKPYFREKLADWATQPTGRIRSKLKEESRKELRIAILNPISWFKGADLPEGHITPWELFILALSSGLSLIAGAFSGKQDFLFKEYYHIKPNMLSVGGIISSIWDATNDPFLGSYMDRKRMGPKQWRLIMRISAFTGHCLNVIKMLDGGMSPWQHIAVLVVCNCMQDIIGTLDSVAGQKLRAGISPYSQQRGRIQVWTNVANTIAYPLSTLPLLLMGLKDILHFNDYQIIVMGTVIMLPFNIFASYLITFIKQRVDFRPGAPIGSLPLHVGGSAAEQINSELTEEDKKNIAESIDAEKRKLKAAREAEARKNMLAEMSRAERRIFKKEERREHRERFKNGQYDVDPVTGEPKLSILESFAIVRHNKFFICNTVANLITTFSPSVDPLLIYRYLVPKFKVGGKEISGEMMWLAHAQVAGTFVTFSKPFSKMVVNLVGGPQRAIQLNHLSTSIGFLLRLFIGYNNFVKLVLNMLIEGVVYVFNDVGTVAETMLNYEMLDYVEMKTGLRTEGVTMSVDALFKKIVTNNIGTVTGNAFLEWTGYTGGYENGTPIPERFSKYMWPMYTIASAADAAIWLIARSCFKYTPEDREYVEAALAKKREAEAAALAQSEEKVSVTTEQ